MPWCPVCKNEYREGIKVCVDCKVDLVDELVEEVKKTVATYMENEAQAQKFVDYLNYSNITAEIESQGDGSFGIVVNEEDINKTTVAYKAYIKSETEKFDEELSKATDVEKAAYKKALLEKAEKMKPAGIYVSQSDTAKDMSATATTFFVFSVLLAVLAPLCYFKVLPFFNDQLPVFIVLLAMAVGCFLVGISSTKRAKVAKANVSDEENNTKLIKEWLNSHADSILDNAYNPVDNTLPEELLYLERSDRLKEALEKEFGTLDSAYVETLIDEFYDSYFGA